VTITAELWTCPECEVSESLERGPDLDERRRTVQLGHAERHRAERKRAQPILEALLEAIEQLAAFRVRLVVAPGDHARVRELVKRRGVAIEVFADSQLALGSGYVMQPRRGVREVRS
jgi:hypothetical protein